MIYRFWEITKVGDGYKATKGEHSKNSVSLELLMAIIDENENVFQTKHLQSVKKEV